MPGRLPTSTGPLFSIPLESICRFRISAWQQDIPIYLTQCHSVVIMSAKRRNVTCIVGFIPQESIFHVTTGMFLYTANFHSSWLCKII